MKSQALTILSIIGVFGTGLTAMAVNSDALSSAVQSPVGKTSESLLLTPTDDSTDTAKPDASATEIPLPADAVAPGDEGDAGEPSAQPSTGSPGTESGSDDAARPAPVPVAPAVAPVRTATPHVEGSEPHETETPVPGETHEKDD